MERWVKKRLIIHIGILIIAAIVIAVFYSASQGEYKETIQDRISTDECYENIVSITFDDGPNHKTTNRLLDGLKERGVNAAFFLVGELAERNPETVKRMSDEGHTIGNHTYSHINLGEVNFDNAINEIKKTNKVIEDITGETVKYIRPPYGIYSDKMLNSCSLTPVLWTVDPDDWKTTNAGNVVKYVVDNVRCGDIILLHDIYDSSVTAALEIIDKLTLKGFRFVTIEEIILD